MSKQKENEYLSSGYGQEDQEFSRKIRRAAEQGPSREVVSSEETEAALSAVRQRLGLPQQHNRADDRVNPSPQQAPYSTTQRETGRTSHASHGNTQHNSSPDDNHGGNKNKKGPSRGFWFGILSAAALVTAAVLFTSYFTSTTVFVPFGEQISYTLPDGSSVMLNSGSTMMYPSSFGRTNRTVQLQGEAYFDVISDEKPFLVHTPLATVHVTGTAFLVRSWETEQASVMVDKGSVSFYPLQIPDSGVHLTAGQFSTLGSVHTRPSDPAAFNRQAAFAWKEQQFAYQNTPVRAILRDLERRFDTTITAEETEILDGTLSTFYSGPTTLETMLNDICTVKGLAFSKTANGFRVYLPR